MFRTETPRSPSPFHFWLPGKKNPSSSPSSKTLSLRARSFDENLLRRLKALKSASDPPYATFSWLSKAIDLLSSTHADAETLISDLTASEKSLASYLDDSVKILDVCNSISSEIERLRQGRLLLNFALHLLDLSAGSPPAPEKLRRARESLSEWAGSSPVASNRRLTLEKSAALIKDLASKFGNSPRGKISSVEKVLERTIYAVGAVTVFVAGVVVATLSGSADLVAIPVSVEFLWSDAFVDLQSAVLGSIKKRFSGEKGRLAVEREAVEASVRALVDVIGDDMAGVEGKTERLTDAVKELGKVTEEFSDGLETLLNGVNGFFRAVLCTRNTLLKSFRGSP